jgi:short subunit dehydrogenase-like uncharacterized protein
VNADPHRIVLLGATGYSGRLIARQLDALEVPFTIAARAEARARMLQAELKTRPPITLLEVLEPQQVSAAVAGAGIVINAVGPYNLYGQVVLEQCRRRQLVYLDLTGEQEFVRQSFDDRRASDWSATVLHSIAFESALADLLAQGMLSPDASYRSIESYYSFSRSRPSPGTLLTMKLAPHFPTYHLQAGRLRRAEPLSFERTVDFETPAGLTTGFFMPYPEVLFFARRYRPHEASSYLLMGEAEALFARAAGRRAAPAVDAILAQHQRQRREGPSEAERRQQRFTLTVHAADHDGNRHTRRLTGSDMYGITAVLVSRVVLALLAGLELPRGPLTPAEVPAWDGLWSRLQEQELISVLAEVA